MNDVARHLCTVSRDITGVRAAGFEPTSHIQAPRSSTSLSKLKETSTLAYQEVKQEVADVLRARWKALGRGSWDGRDIAVLGNGAKFRPLAIAPEESQFIQTQKFSVATIARFYGVPPEMVAGETAGHEAYTSPEMRGTDFLTFTLRPWLARIERAVSGLLPSTQRAKFNAGGFLRATLKEQYEALAIGVGAGIVMPNEARGKLDLPALPGLDRPAEPPEGGAVA